MRDSHCISEHNQPENRLLELTPSELGLPFKRFDISKKSAIYHATQQADGFYYIESGLIGLHRITESGKEHLIRVYGSNEYFGYRSLLSNQKYHLTTKALLPSCILHIQIHHFQQLLDHSPKLLMSLVSSVCSELGEAENRLSDTAAYNSKVRILNSIIELFQKFDYYPWTAREIAEHSGTEVQTVLRYCKDLKKLALLKPEARGIKPRDLCGLKSLRDRITFG